MAGRETASSDPLRQARLKRLFEDSVRGTAPISSSRQSIRFIEALCSQEDATECVHKLTSNPNGLNCLKTCVRCDLSSEFLNGPAVQLLEYLSNPAIAIIDAGEVLGAILSCFVEHQFFWSAMVEAVRKQTASPDAIHAFAWLWSKLLQLLPPEKCSTYIQLAKDTAMTDPLSKSSDPNTRKLWYEIHHNANNQQYSLPTTDDGPGGRHDNDAASIKDISILPTEDELLCKVPPFLRMFDEINECEKQNRREFMHIDNQFRLLREDLISVLREEIQTIRDGSKRFHHGNIFRNLYLRTVYCQDVSDRNTAPPWKWSRWGLLFQSWAPLPGLERKTVKQRKAFLSDANGPGQKILRHKSLACILADNEVAGFGSIQREADLLAQDQPDIIVEIESRVDTALQKLSRAKTVVLVQVDTAVFAYEPFLLKLQQMRKVPLAEALLHWTENGPIPAFDSAPTQLLNRLLSSRSGDLKDILATPKSIVLDESQFESLHAGLTQRVSLIQGPPGTGKSFIGALLAKAILASTRNKILVVCFTNHAVVQFVEDLLDIGIPSHEIILMASKLSDRTEPLTIRNQKSTHKLNRSDWFMIDESRTEIVHWRHRMFGCFKKFRSAVDNASLMSYLDFADEPYPFFEAFEIPPSDGMQRVGKKGKAIDQYYLLDRWIKNGTDTSPLNEKLTSTTRDIWQLSPSMRKQYLDKWYAELKKEELQEVCKIGSNINKIHDNVQKRLSQGDKQILMSKRVIACTTTKAAMYTDVLRQVAPEVVLVEEAGEILEAHILTSIGPGTEQLIMIGDHLQLRPKAANYNLSVEKGSGYDLNRSLFERLVLQGYPHNVLTKQHRMRPEISAMVRHMTYPDLVDADATENRPHIRGLQNDVVFVEHGHPETMLHDMRERMPGTSKQNTYEATIVLQYVKYLVQQGYGSDDIVILTPYLGQMRLLREQLKELGDPVLNDMDRHDLLYAGLLGPDTTSKKRSVHLATIDNYQGEEKPIVLVSLTRSNDQNDVGFMYQPERLNVLLSRARDGLVVIGNFRTFFDSKKGGATWKKLYDFVSKRGHTYSGLPVKCQSHPSRTATLESVADFLKFCPDGGCSEPCGALLSCGVHKCPHKCHILSDHSKLLCGEILESRCSQGHKQTWKCHDPAPLSCKKCEKEDERRKKRAKEAFDLQEKREQEAQNHAKEMEELDAQIEASRQSFADARLGNERAGALDQKRRDLRAALQASVKNSKPPLFQDILVIPKFESSNVTNGTEAAEFDITIRERMLELSPENNKSATSAAYSLSKAEFSEESLEIQDSPSEIDWKQQKTIENASNDAIDELMNLVGLEQVKSQALSIKAKIDTSKRQGVDLSKERYHVSFLGNPGTGKTTVARLYAKMLASLQILPGDEFQETSGSKLAHDGVQGAKAQLDKILSAGGGVFFIDEAYQLTSGKSFGGGGVLDFLLTEIENLTGKVCFIFAGYNKPMEAFFAHNPGLPSRVPYSMVFEDYRDKEFLVMLQKLFVKKFSGRAKLARGFGGLFARILVRRLGRGRGRAGFGNMRDLENIFTRVLERQAKRLHSERRAGLHTDDFFFSQEDVIGPDPATAIIDSCAWTQLQELIGLKEVKGEVEVLLDLIKTNYKRELEEMEPIQTSLNRVFLGSPGTGKTSVAKLYGQILADIGLLSIGEVVVKNPADFIGAALGTSEQNTKAILQAAKGKVLIVDEAYTLGPGGENAGNVSDPYKTAVIDTMVAEIQSTPGEDRCVLLLGYETQMRRMFQAVNEGFTRRFPLESAFRFHDFDDTELQDVLALKLKQQDLKASPEAISVAIEILSRERNGLNFGNAGAVENLISKAKTNFQHRNRESKQQNQSCHFTFEPQDFDLDFARALNAEQVLHELFRDVVGSERLVKQLRDLQRLVEGTKAKGIDPREHVPTNFVFKGPPGTGKTSTARKIGRVFYDMGILSYIEVVECSETDLIGEFVGTTGPKTRRQLEKGLGRVLFVDEAYRLKEGHYATEAVNELVDLLTKPEFKGRLIVILAGYEQEMNELMQVNPGLSSRFPEVVMFDALSSRQCIELLLKQFEKNQVESPDFKNTGSAEYLELKGIFEKLATLSSWGNGRDVDTIAKKCMRSYFADTSASSAEIGQLASRAVLDCIALEWEERSKREEIVVLPRHSSQWPLSVLNKSMQPPRPKTNSEIAKKEIAAPEAALEEQTTFGGIITEHKRDVDVSDMDWEQLCRDAELERQALRAAEEALGAQQDQVLRASGEVSELFRKEEKLENELKSATTKSEDLQSNGVDDELKRALEKARIARVEAQSRRDAEQKKLDELREMQRQEKRKEAIAQAKLREMGVCPVGFRWIKQGTGYRCAGGSHFVSNDELGM